MKTKSQVAYFLRDVIRLTGLTHRTLWAFSHFHGFTPGISTSDTSGHSHVYSERDIVLLRVVAALKKLDVSDKTLGRAFAFMEKCDLLKIANTSALLLLNADGCKVVTPEQAITICRLCGTCIVIGLGNYIDKEAG